MDVYFRGYRDLGDDGFEVTEMVADPEDIMGDPGSGPVLRRHFEKVIGIVLGQLRAESSSPHERHGRCSNRRRAALAVPSS